jgi:hypothetical protein
MSNNSSIYTADRNTHLKIFGLALVAGITVVVIGIAAGARAPDMSTQLEARAPVLKADKPAVWTSSDRAVIR